MDTLTENEDTAYRRMLAAWVERKPMPTIRELAGIVGISQTGAHNLLKALEAKGWIQREPYGSIRLTCLPKLCGACGGSGLAQPVDLDALGA